MVINSNFIFGVLVTLATKPPIEVMKMVSTEPGLTPENSGCAPQTIIIGIII